MKTTAIKFKPIYTFILTLLCTYLHGQVQKGADIDGEAADDNSGLAVSMPDANTIAIGAPFNSGGGNDAGHVRIYTWSGTSWQQKGADIDGEAGDLSGYAISMPDPNTVAIGAEYNDASGTDAGRTRIYAWNGSAWTLKGNPINGEGAADYFGHAVSMPDPNTIAIGAHFNDGSGTDAGHVRVFTWTGSAWQQKGIDIDGEAAIDGSGNAVSMPDANTLAIGAPYNDGAGTDVGHVRIFEWNGSAWIQKGTDIDGENPSDQFGRTVSMPDPNTVAIGATDNDATGQDAGHVRVYEWNGTSWIQKGIDIDGEAAGDHSGGAVSMPDPNTIAIGAYDNGGTAANAGHVRIYSWNSTAWVQVGADIDGEAMFDASGQNVSMPDPNTVAIGAPYNSGSGSLAGHARVYSLQTLAIPQPQDALAPHVFPNPSLGKVTIAAPANLHITEVTVIDPLGRQVMTSPTSSSPYLTLTLPELQGIFLLQVGYSDGHSQYCKVMRK